MILFFVSLFYGFVRKSNPEREQTPQAKEPVALDPYLYSKPFGSVEILTPRKENLSAPALGKGPFARRQPARWQKLDFWHLPTPLGK
jgi:hypothetical protein